MHFRIRRAVEFTIIAASATGCERASGGGVERTSQVDEALSESDTRVTNYDTVNDLPHAPADLLDLGEIAAVTDSDTDRLGLWTLKPSGPGIATGKWVPIVTDFELYNVRDFGAVPNDGVSDSVAIEAAIEAAQAGHGGIIYFPAGEYTIGTTITLPKLRFSNGFPLYYVGDGMFATSLRAEADALSPTQPVLMHPDDNNAVSGGGIIGMSISRASHGTVFQHWTADDVNGRMYHYLIRDVMFQGADYGKCDRPVQGHPDQCNGVGPDQSQAEVVKLNHVHDTIIENVIVNGEETALRLDHSSRVTLRNIHMSLDDYTRSFIRIQAGGSHTLSGLRTEALRGGVAIALQAGVSECSQGRCELRNIEIEDFSEEGGNIFRTLSIEGTFDGSGYHYVRGVHARNLGVSYPSGATAGTTGIYVNGLVRNVDIEGGHTSLFTNLSKPAIVVENGASNIKVRDMLLLQGDLTTAEQSVEVGSETSDVRVELWGENDHRPYVATSPIAGLVMSCSGVPCEEASVGGTEAFVVPPSGVSRNLATLLGGHPGQRLILVFSDGQTTITNAGNIRLSGGASWTGSNHSTLTLIFDGTSWLEAGRAD